MTVYKVVNFHLEQKQKKVRHPGSPAEGQVIQTTAGIIELTQSNQVWQCDYIALAPELRMLIFMICDILLRQNG